jgi:hypothetical protein
MVITQEFLRVFGGLRYTWVSLIRADEVGGARESGQSGAETIIRKLV